MRRLNENPIFPERASSAEGPDPCELAQNPRYRKGPDVCFDNNENVRHKHSAGMGLKFYKKTKHQQLKTVSLVSHGGCMLSDAVWFSSALLTACSLPFVRASLTYFHYYSSICHYFACMCCLFLSSALHVISPLMVGSGGGCFCLVGRTPVPNQRRFSTELHTSLVVSGDEFRVSFLTQVHTLSSLNY